MIPALAGSASLVYPSGHKDFFSISEKCRDGLRRTLLRSVSRYSSIEAARGTQSWRELMEKFSEWKNNDFRRPRPFCAQATRATHARWFAQPLLRPLVAETESTKIPPTPQKMLNGSSRSIRLLAPPGSSVKSAAKISSTMHINLKERVGPYTANRVLQLLRALFNWAIHPDSELWSGVNPAAKIDLFGEEERKRFLDGPELATLFTALKDKKTSSDLRAYANLAFWTGARKSDVLSMR